MKLHGSPQLMRGHPDKPGYFYINYFKLQVTCKWTFKNLYIVSGHSKNMSVDPSLRNNAIKEWMVGPSLKFRTSVKFIVSDKNATESGITIR